MATNADIQKWIQTVYQQQYSLSSALTNHALAPTNLAKKEKKLEVLLFRAMMDYFDYHPSCLATVVHTDETHQHYVYPKGLKGYCEISDVLFMVFYRQYKTLRVTHMQAKRKKKTDIVTFPWNGSSAFEFTIDPKQYCLLNRRLPFINRGKSKYPVATLCSPELSDSIASYGVFYFSQNNDWHIAYEVASLVGNPSAKKGLFYSNYNLIGYINELWSLAYPTHYAWEQIYANNDHVQPQVELLSTLDTALFEAELINCHVGSVVSRSNPLLLYVAGVLKARYNRLTPQQQVLVNAFNEYLLVNDLNVRDQQLDDSVLPMNIVLINADDAYEYTKS